MPFEHVDRAGQVIEDAATVVDVDPELDVVRAAKPVFRRQTIDREELQPPRRAHPAGEVVALLDGGREREILRPPPSHRRAESAERHGRREQAPTELGVVTHGHYLVPLLHARRDGAGAEHVEADVLVPLRKIPDGDPLRVSRVKREIELREVTLALGLRLVPGKLEAADGTFGNRVVG